VIAVGVSLFNMKAGIQFFVVGMILLVAYNGCLKDDSAGAIGSDNQGLTLGYSDSYAPSLVSGMDVDSLLAVNNPDWGTHTDIGPRDLETSAERFYTETHSSGGETHAAGLVGAVGNGGYGGYAPNANANTALFVGFPFEESQTGSLNDANSDSAKTIVHDEDPEMNLPPEAGYGVGGGWGHGWAPGTGLSFHPDLTVAREGSVAYENDPESRFLEQVSQVDGRDSYAALTEDAVYSPYNTATNIKPDSGYPTPEGVSGQWVPGVVPYTGSYTETKPGYLNSVYTSPSQSAHPDAGSGVPNAGTAGIMIDGTQPGNSHHAMGAHRMSDGLKKKASNVQVGAFNGAGSGGGFVHTPTGGTVPIAGSTSDYSSNGYSNLYSGDSGNNDPEHYVTIDKRQPINQHAFINDQNIASYQPVKFSNPIDRSERLDAKTFQMWKDLTMFDQNPSRDETNKLLEYAGTNKISDQSFEPTYYKDARRREEIKKGTFSSFINERTAQDHGILDDVPEFRRQMMRDYTPMRRRAISFRAGSNAPREFAAPGNVPLTPLRPPMTPSPATPGY